MKDLIAKLEAATEGDEQFDAAIYRALDLPLMPVMVDGMRRIYPAYTTSIDAATTLVPDGWQWAMNAPNVEGEMNFRAEVDYSNSTWAATAPLALCIAALKARAVSGARD